MTIELKIKSKHLAKEAQIIREEEKKILEHSRNQIEYLKSTGHNGDLFEERYKLQAKYRSLREHRIKEVRNEARATQLARAFIAGKPYSAYEQKRKPEKEFYFLVYVLPSIVRMVQRYGNLAVTKDDILEWASLE